MGLLNKKAQTDEENIEVLPEQETPVFKVLNTEEKRETEIDPFLEETKEFKKTLLNGYSQSDVDQYVEILKCNMGRVQKQLSEEIRGITAEKANVINERNVLRAQLKEAEKEKRDAQEALKDMAILEEHLEEKKITIQDLKAQNEELLVAGEKAREYRSMIVECEDHIRELEELQKEKEEKILSLQKEIEERTERLTEDYEEKLRVIKEKYDLERDAHAKTREACFKAEEGLRKIEKEMAENPNGPEMKAEYEKRLADMQEAYKKECALRKEAEEVAAKVRQRPVFNLEQAGHNAEMDKELEKKDQLIRKLESALRSQMQNRNVEQGQADEEITEKLKAEQARRVQLEKQIEVLQNKLVTENAEKDHSAEQEIRESVKAEYENQVSHLETQIRQMEDMYNRKQAQTEQVIEKAVQNRENILKINYEERLRQSKENYDASVDSLKKLMNEKCIEIRKVVEEDMSKQYENKITKAREKCAEAQKEGLSFKEALEDIMGHIDEMKARETLRMEQSVADRKKISDLLYEVAKVRLENSTSLDIEERE